LLGARRDREVPRRVGVARASQVAEHQHRLGNKRVEARPQLGDTLGERIGEVGSGGIRPVGEDDDATDTVWLRDHRGIDESVQEAGPDLSESLPGALRCLQMRPCRGIEIGDHAEDGTGSPSNARAISRGPAESTANIMTACGTDKTRQAVTSATCPTRPSRDTSTVA
jgi:hypothetical protein